MVAIERIYESGGCNISREEERLRLVSGWVGTVLTLAAGVAFVWTGTPRGWRWVLVLPAVLASTGFLQAGLHFCANYGWRGVFNVAGPVGKTETVSDPEMRRRDRRKALTILVGSLVIAVIVTAVDVIL